MMKESETLELKKSVAQLEDALKSACAFLNHKGGEIWFGVAPDGTVRGADSPESTMRKISQPLRQRIRPETRFEVRRDSYGGKGVMRLKIPEGARKPYFLDGVAYIRVGVEDVVMPPAELERLIVEKNREKLRWDNEACPGAKISDIGSKKLGDFVRKAGLRHESVQGSLKKLGMLSKGRPVNAAVLLFGRQPQKLMRHAATLRCAVFGESTAVTISMQDYEGDMFSLMKRAEEFVRANIHVGMRLEGLERIDVPEVDMEAVREAVINAFSHRDYREPDSVRAAVFRDRVEITNPGRLFGGLTVERITHEEVSERRNPLIADMLHRIHFVEKWGRGIGLILSKEPEARFEEIGTHFRVVFPRKAAGTTPETTPKTTPKTGEQIMGLLKSSPQITKEEIAAALGLTHDGVKYHIKRLKSRGSVRWVGPSRGGHWETK